MKNRNLFINTFSCILKISGLIRFILLNKTKSILLSITFFEPYTILKEFEGNFSFFKNELCPILLKFINKS